MHNWEDIRLFAIVARSGGLAAAARAIGSSPPTLGRKMMRLERATGQTLFVRHRGGYDLTEAGEELLGLAENLERSAAAIDRWHMQSDACPVIQIAAGPWTASFLAAHLTELACDDDIQIEILSGSASVDLSRREAQIGLRNRRPDGRGLAGRKLARVVFAIYCSTANRHLGRSFPAFPVIDDGNWIELAAQGPMPPSALWLRRKLGGKTPVRLPTTHAVLECAASGAGLCVLPCFVGDRHPGLVRASHLIADLDHDQWLVTHDEDRHIRPVRTVINRLDDLITANRPLFAGQFPAPTSDSFQHKNRRSAR